MKMVVFKQINTNLLQCLVLPYMYVYLFLANFVALYALFQTVRLLNRTNFQKYSIEKLLFCTFYSQQIASNSPLSTYVHSSTYFLHLIGTLGVSNGPRIDPCTFIRVLSALYVYKIFEMFHPVCLFPTVRQYETLEYTHQWCNEQVEHSQPRQLGQK